MNTLSTTTAAQAPPSRWALASLSLSMLLPSLDTSIANAGLPALAGTFEASFAQVQWIVLAYLLSITTLLVSAGRLGDLMGRRRLLLCGISLFTLASLLCGLAPSLGWLIAARALQGFGAAIMLALTLALVGETVPKARIGSAMGLLGSLSAIGTTLGPALGGVLLVASGWQAIFLVSVPLGLLNGWLAWRYLPADGPFAKGKPRGFDLPGSLVLALTLGAYALAMTQGHWVLLLLAAAGAGLFVWRQGRVAVPLVRLQLLGDRQLSAGLAMSLLVSTVIMSTLVVGPFYLARGLGLDALAVGLVLAAGPAVAALSGVPAGRLVDRWGMRRMTQAGLLGIALGATALALLPSASAVPGYLMPMLLLTASYALFQAANNTSIMAGIDPQQRGVVAGLLSLSRNLGLISGAACMGALFAFATAADVSVASAPALAQGLHASFAVATVLIILALLISHFALGKRGQSGTPD